MGVLLGRTKKKYIYEKPEENTGKKVRLNGHDLVILKNNELSNEAVIVGTCSFKRIDSEKEEDKLIIGDRHYKLEIKTESPVKNGIYIRVTGEDDKETYIRIKKNKKTLIILLALILSLGTASLFYVNGDGKKPWEPDKPDLEIAIGDDVNNIPEESEEIDYENYIELPYLSTVTVKDNPVPLQNPEGNTVYMGFKVIYNEETIYESDGVVKPGEFVNWNAKEYFKEAGQYNVRFIISTYDINDQTDCSSANIESVITVK